MRKISIVTVTYNSSKNLSKYFNALVLNKQHISEVFIIENNSPDKVSTKKICQKFATKLNLTYIENENVGFGSSCNLGAKKSTGEYILFLNPDTELNKDSLEILLAHRELNKADIMGGKALNYNQEPHGSVVRIPNLYVGLFEFSNLGKLFRVKGAHEYFYYEDLQILKSEQDRIVDAVSGGYMLLTRKAFKKLRGFDENIFMYLEDVDLGKRAKELGLKTVFCPHSAIWHIGGASSKNKYKINHPAWFKSRKYYFKKHFGLLMNCIVQPLYTIEEILLRKIKSL